ncbi:uncharacterized protein [Rutidosis leptorrhynchoides]|uniref:uncharacterized protein n=1 Tax=Rutidosis leptorrhynchoides TaxID=125765 RepID=UPI003A9A1CFE
MDFLKGNKKKGILFKVDFEKAFDCLNWDFLLDVMKSMGFGMKWRKWIFACLKSAIVSVLVNGSPTNEFSLGRGIRQGDPLSPFLFILAAEGLNILAKAAIEKGLFKGIEVGGDKILISHLQYADDTIFLGERNRENAYSLQNLLKCFELVSGLKVNFHKSFLYGIGVNDGEVDNMARWLNCQVGSFPFTYLGLPIGAKMNKINSWNPVLDKFKARLSSHEVNNVGVNFSNSFEKKICTVSSSKFWEEIWVGGNKLRFTFPRLYRLENVKDVAIKDRVEISGSSRLWKWDWARDPRGRTSRELENLCGLISAYNFSGDGFDSWTWNLANYGDFRVKSLCKLIEEQSVMGPTNASETMRNRLVPKKLEIFVWRAVQRRLPTRLELDKRGIDLYSTRCPLCDDDLESVEHSLILCKHAYDLWVRVYSWWGLGNVSNLSISEIFCGNNSAGMSTLGKKIWQAVEWVCTYLI